MKLQDNNLTSLISTLYPAQLGNDDARDAALNLVGFVDLLMEIDRQQPSQPTEAVPCK